MTVYIETAVGLPNTCAGCGKAVGATWFAANDDQARAGQGYHPDSACLPEGVVTVAQEPPAAPPDDKSADSGAKPRTAAKKRK